MPYLQSDLESPAKKEDVAATSREAVHDEQQLLKERLAEVEATVAALQAQVGQRRTAGGATSSGAGTSDAGSDTSSGTGTSGTPAQSSSASTAQSAHAATVASESSAGSGTAPAQRWFERLPNPFARAARQAMFPKDEHCGIGTDSRIGSAQSPAVNAVTAAAEAPGPRPINRSNDASCENTQ